jgi:acylphosphatase
MDRKRYRVRGRVQGVGFRAWLLRQADALALRGWACNHADGSVEVEAEGESDALQRLRELLAVGPRLARVDAVEELPVGTATLPPGFDIVSARRA